MSSVDKSNEYGVYDPSGEVRETLARAEKAYMAIARRLMDDVAREHGLQEARYLGYHMEHSLGCEISAHSLRLAMRTRKADTRTMRDIHQDALVEDDQRTFDEYCRICEMEELENM